MHRTDLIDDISAQLSGIAHEIAKVAGSLPAAWSTNKGRAVTATTLHGLSKSLSTVADRADPVAQPDGAFDPNDPTIKAVTLALNLVKRTKKPLCDLSAFYGSGVYALYYDGPSPVYSLISGTESPIYVGKADPDMTSNIPREQGQRLYRRLAEHKKNFEKVGLPVGEFKYRYLPLGDSSQVSVEKVLISFFKPVWNDTVLYGFGKHGDAATKRANTRSPWDTMHPGRKWAKKNVPGSSQEEIIADAIHYLMTTTIYRSVSEVSDALQL